MRAMALRVGVCTGFANDALVETITGRLGYLPVVSDYLDCREPTMAGGWSVNYWAQHGPKNGHYVFGIPLQFASAGGSGAANPAYPPAAILAGDYDADYISVFARIAALDEHGIVRLGWEMNGVNSFAWGRPWTSVEDFIALFQHVAVLAHTHHLSVAWNPALIQGEELPSEYWPGDAFVDRLGPDIYTQGWAQTANPTEPELWDQYLPGLDAYVALNAATHKNLLLPEVGCWPPALTFPSEGGTGDDPYFIQQMMEWATEHHALIVWWCQGTYGLFTPATPKATAQACVSPQD